MFEYSAFANICNGVRFALATSIAFAVKQISFATIRLNEGILYCTIYFLLLIFAILHFAPAMCLCFSQIIFFVCSIPRLLPILHFLIKKQMCFLHSTALFAHLFNGLIRLQRCILNIKPGAWNVKCTDVVKCEQTNK